MSGREVTEIDVRIGQRIRACRLEQGVTQMALADQLGVTFQQLQKYELGINRVAASRLYEIARALRAPVARFLPDPDGEALVSPELERAMATPEGLQLFQLFGSLQSSKTRKALVALARAVAVDGAAA